MWDCYFPIPLLGASNSSTGEAHVAFLPLITVFPSPNAFNYIQPISKWNPNIFRLILKGILIMPRLRIELLKVRNKANEILDKIIIFSKTLRRLGCCISLSYNANWASKFLLWDQKHFTHVKRKRLEIKDDLLHYLQYLLYFGILRHFQTLYHQGISKYIFSASPEKPFDTKIAITWISGCAELQNYLSILFSV